MDPTPKHFARELALAVRLAQVAGSQVQHAFEARRFDVTEKADDQGLVTSADKAANTFITAGIAEAFPDDAIVAEESADHSQRAHRTWFVDPIDGTSQFVNGVPEFAVMIGLFVGGEPAMGVVYQPTTDVLAYATQGDGAFVVHSGDEPTRLGVSKQANVRALRIVRSRSHPSARIERFCVALPVAAQQQMGSLGLKIVEIAAGRADLYLNLSGKVSQWDAAGPQVILVEAGGHMATATGGPVCYDADALALADGMVASNGHIHGAVLEMLAKVP